MIRSLKQRSFAACAAAALALTGAASAQQILVPEDYTWSYLHPMGQLPLKSDFTPDADFDTTWYLAQAAFLATYDGPSFDASTIGDPAIIDSADSGPGVGPFEYGTVDSIPIPNTTFTTPNTGNRYTAYFRSTFTVPAGGVIEPTIRGSFDDGAYIYLDGALIATVNITDGVTDTYTSVATDATNTETTPPGPFTIHFRSTGLQPGGTPGDVNVLTAIPSLAEGEHTLAVSVHNNANSSSDLGMLFELSGLDPAACTLHPVVSDVVRDLRGTPVNTADDQFSFKVTLTGSNNGASWTSDSTPPSGAYGVATSFGPFDANLGPATVNFNATGNPACSTFVTVDPPTAFKTFVPYGHTWKTMNPQTGVLPPKPAGGADADFESTWFLKEANFLTTYDGPNFGANGVAGTYEALTGPGPFDAGGVDGIAAGQPVGQEGTTPLLPASGNRRTSYYRTTFTTAEPLSLVTLDLLCDDGVFIYLDGNLVAQENMTAPPGFMSLAAAARAETSLITIDLSQPPGGNVLATVPGLAPGEHTLAVALHQSATNSSDYGLALQLSGIEVTGQCVMDATTSNLQRNDAGTPGNPADDTFSFSVVIDAANAGATWNSDSVPASGSYGTLTGFGPFPVSGGTKTVLFTSSIDPACTTSVAVAPPACTMSITAGPATRDGNGTPTDPRDDTFSFPVTPTGTFLSPQWNSNATPASGAYNVATVMGPFPITGATTVTLTDSVETTCTASVTVQVPRYVPIAELVPYSQTWKVMNPLNGALPDGPGGPDTDFDTTWYLAEDAFNLQYNGPTFGTGGVAGSYEAIEGPGPLAAGGVDGIAAGMTVGPPGTNLTLPATGLRYSSYYRTTFTTASDMDNLKFDLLCDDAVFIYLDGELVALENIAEPDTFTGLATGGARNETLLITIDLSEAPGANVVKTVSSLPAGTHTLAVSLHQTATDSSDIGLALTFYGRPSTGCVVTPVVSNVTRNFNGTPSPADDTFSFTVNVTAVSGGAGWTSNAIPASGSYGVPVNFGPLPVSEAPKSIIFSDTTDPLCRTTSIIDVPPIFGTKSLGGGVLPVLPELPIPANWTSNGAAISHSTSVSVAAPGSVISSELVDLSAVAGPVQFRMNLTPSETSTGTNFETNDTVLVELVLNDGVSEQRINLITPFDSDGNGVLNGYTGVDVADYDLNRAMDELNGSQVDAASSATHTFALSHVIPDSVVSARVVVTVVALGSSETLTVSDVTFSPAAAVDDTDGDGQSDASELVAGTSPTDPNDFLHITGITQTGGGASVTFPTKVGKNYQAEASNRLNGGWAALGGVIAGTGGPVTAGLPQVPVPGESKYFLRIRVVP